MQIYSEYSAPRIGQIVADILALGVVVCSVWLGLAVAGLVKALGDVGAGLEDAGATFQGTMSDAARAVGGVPLLGQSVSSPFVSASDAGATLAAAGQSEQALVGDAAVLIGVLVAGVPIAIVGWLWLRRRVGFVKTAATVRRLSGSAGGVEFLALRALSRADSSRLLVATPHLVQAWRQGDPVVIRVLAEDELRRAGLRPSRLVL